MAKRRSVDDVETLVLCHFTHPPRIGFGKILVGQTKTRTILVQNPTDYEQEVLVEKFPYKKGFNIDQIGFTVGPQEVVSLTLTWSPQEAGGCREMILFHINGVYRLQAYVFGLVEEPKPVKKGRKGLLGTRKQRSGQTSMVLETKSLRSICDSYSPRRSAEIRELRAQARLFKNAVHDDQENIQPVELDDGPHQMPPLESTAICHSSERPDRLVAKEMSLSEAMSPTLSKMSPIPRAANTSINGHVLETFFLTSAEREQTPVLTFVKDQAGKNVLKNNDVDVRSLLLERSPLRPLSRNGSLPGGNGTLFPELSPRLSQQQMLDDSEENQGVTLVEGERCQQEEDKSDSPEGSGIDLCGGCPEAGAVNHVSPSTFLNNSLAGAIASSITEVGHIVLSTQAKKVIEQATVSPGSFLQDLTQAKVTAGDRERRTSVPSPSVVLNDSIPHDIIMKQLQHIRRSITGPFASPFAGSPAAPAPSAVAAMLVKTSTAVRPLSQDRLKLLAQPKVYVSVASRDQDKHQKKREKFLQKKIYEQSRLAKVAQVPSPRRKTFLVNKKNQLQSGKKSPQKSFLKGGSSKALTLKPAAMCREAALKLAAARDIVASSVSVCNISTGDGTMTPRRRSLWASPAVAGFEPPVLATRRDNDSTGEACSTLHAQDSAAADPDNVEGGGRLEYSLSPLSAAQPDTPVSKLDVTASQPQRNSGRRLFPDVSEIGESDSPCARPLWAGTATVTKERLSCSPPYLSGPATMAKKLFPGIGASADGAACVQAADGGGSLTPSHSDSCSFTPSQLLSHHSPIGDEAVRRATLTVTKLQPSQALIDARLGDKDRLAAQERKEIATEAVDRSEEEEWHTDTIVIETKDSTIVSVSVTRGTATPSHLPTSPLPETSRRSTHVVRNPVVLNKDVLLPRNLFTDDEGKDGLAVQNTHFIDRVEYKIHYPPDRILKPSTTFSAVADVNIESSCSSTDLSTDSLEPDQKFLPVNDETTKVDVDLVFRNQIAGEDQCSRPLFSELCLTEGGKLTCNLSASSSDTDMSYKTADDGNGSDIARLSDVDRKYVHFVGENNVGQNQKVLGKSKQFLSQVDQDLFGLDDVDASGSELNSFYISVASRNNENIFGDNSGLLFDVFDETKCCEEQAQTNLSDISCLEMTPVPNRTALDSRMSWLPTATYVDPMAAAKGNVAQSFNGPDIEQRVVSTGNVLDVEASVGIDPIKKESMLATTAILKEKLEKVVEMVRSEKAPDLKVTNTTIVHGDKILAAESTVIGLVPMQQSALVDLEVEAPASSAAAKSMKHKKSASTASDWGQTGKTRLPLSSEKGQPHSPRLASQAWHSASGLDRTPPPLSEQDKRGFFSRKRTSPEAGLKEPTSKKVELDLCDAVPKNILQSQPRSQKHRAVSVRAVRVSASKGETAKARKPCTGVSLSKLILVKKDKSALPKHPLPFAAKNMYYDERWQDKQERGFVHWLNFVLTPAEEYISAVNKTRVDARAVAFDKNTVPRLAPSKEVLSYRAYAARQRLNHLRRASCHLFQSEQVVRVVCRLELEVEQRRLAVRSDRMVHADIGLKQKILDMLLSYNPLWLRIGLETIYGEVLALQSNSDVLGMSHFILTRLLTSPDIAAQYSHPTVPHLYNEGYAVAVAQHMLKKFLVLVYFLDFAKQSRLLTHDPCLFCKDAEIKTSKDMLVQFSRDYLSGEGDVTKHLAYMGYVVSHAQSLLDEFDYAVANLCTDLRDGLRLGRVLTLMTGNWELGTCLRAPAISRLQKIHNVEQVLKVLTKRGVDLSLPKGGVVTARDIVDGHREKTLAFLWKVIFHFQAAAMIKEAELEEEVRMLERTLRMKLCMQRLLPQAQCTDTVACRDSGGPSAVMDSPMLQLLLRWCRTVCLHYGVKVENFTVSFSDGRALCCLLHHYHPGLLPLASVRFATTQSVQEAAEREEEWLDNSDADLGQVWGTTGREGDEEHFKLLLANEKENFKTLYEKVSELGGIPLMLKAADMSNTIPDERVVVTYVSYLCARLLDLREETRAARLIQLAWRRFCLRRSARLQQRQVAACLVIQRYWRAYMTSVLGKKLEMAATCLQAAWRGHRGRRQAALLRHSRRDAILQSAATVIQNAFRAHRARQSYLSLRSAALKIQNWYRLKKLMRSAKQEAAMLRAGRRQGAAVTIQRFFRRVQAGRLLVTLREKHLQEEREQQELLRKIEAAVVIQKHFRCYSHCVKFQALRNATVIIQNWFKAQLSRKIAQRHYQNLKSATITIQRRYRDQLAKKLAQRQYQNLKSAGINIQCWYRAQLARKSAQRQYQALKSATITVQSWYRAHLARKLAQQKYQALKSAAFTIQRWYRAQLARKSAERQYKALKAATITVQRRYKAQLAKKFAQQQYQALKSATITVQRRYRAQLARKLAQRQYKNLKSATITIQRWYRTKQAQKIAQRKYQALKSATFTIQRWYRARLNRKLAQQQYKALKSATITIQRWYRAHQAQKIAQRKYQAMKSAAITVQRWYRAQLARKSAERQYKNLKSVSINIQRWYRAQLARKSAERQYKNLKSVSINIQRWYRAQLARKSAERHYKALKAATITIQRWYRTHQARKIAQRKYQTMKSVAFTIQRWFRAQLARRFAQRQYQALKSAAITVQRWYRAQLARRFAQRQYQALKSAAITVQRWYRAQLARKLAQQQYKALKSATITLQCWFRAYQVRTIAQRKFQAIKSATITIQRWFRAKLARKLAQQQYQALKSATTTVQRWYRAQLAKKLAQRQYKNLKSAAITIQRWYRAHQAQNIAQKKYQAIKSAALTIQRWYRAQLARKLAQTQYKNLKTVSINIQRWYRAHQARKIAQRKYQAMKSATFTVQRWYRAQLARKLAQMQYQAFKSAVFTIQRWYRAHQARKSVQRQYQALKSATITIQRWYRAHQARKSVQRQYQALKSATITIQRWYRTIKLQKAARRDSAAIAIQSFYRGCLGRREVALLRLARRKEAAALTIQFFFRSVQACRMLETMQENHLQEEREQQEMKRQTEAAVVIQKNFRCYRRWVKFQALRMATIIVQRWYRAHQARKIAQRKYQALKSAAIAVQRWYRAQLARKLAQRQYQALKSAAIIVQRLYRAHKLREAARREAAAVMIQSFYRGCVACRQFVKKRVAAAVTLQCFIRRSLACKRLELLRAENQRNLAVLVIQSSVRTHLARRELYHLRMSSRMHLAAVKIQKAFKCYVVKRQLRVLQLTSKRTSAAVTIQSAYRRHAAVRKLESLKSHARRHRAARQIQAVYRRFVATKVLTALRAARRKELSVITIQSHLRALLARRFVSSLKGTARREKAIRKIQAWFRGCWQRRKYRSLVKSVLLLQTFTRGWQARRRYQELREGLLILVQYQQTYDQFQAVVAELQQRWGAALTLQAAWRSTTVRWHYLGLRASVILLQSAVRAKQVRKQFLHLKEAAMTIQRRYRALMLGRCQRRRYQLVSSAAVVIQAHWKGYLTRTAYAQFRTNVIACQARCRQLLARKRASRLMQQERNNYLCLRQACVRVQAVYRARCVHRHFLQLRQSALVLQAATRGLQQRRRYVLLRWAALVVQDRYRAKRLGSVFRQAFLLIRGAAVVIQASYRCHAAREDCRRRLGAVLVLQAGVRRHLQRKQFLEQQRQGKRELLLQRFAASARPYLAACLIQRWYRRFLAVRIAGQQLHYVVSVQSCIRAYLQRRYFLLNKRHAQVQHWREERAARTIQSALRKWLKEQGQKKRIRHIILLQALWRGRRLRRSLTCKKIAVARQRVEVANQKVTEDKKLGNRTASALDFLLKYKQLSHILDALINLDVATRLSPKCCERLVEVNAVSVIYRLIVSCNRSLPHMELIKYSVSVLLNLAKYELTAPAVYEVENSVTTLLTLLSIYREKGGAIFTKTCLLMAVLALDHQRREAMRCDKQLVSGLQSIHALVVRKHRLQAARARAAAGRISLNATLPCRFQGPQAARVRPAWSLRRDTLHEVEDPLAAISLLMNALHIGPK